MDVQQLNHRLSAGFSHMRQWTRKGDLHDRRDQRRHGRVGQAAVLAQQLRAAGTLDGHQLDRTRLVGTGPGGHRQVRAEPEHVYFATLEVWLSRVADG